jgi:type II secretory pathway pseudopilin PulG
MLEILIAIVIMGIIMAMTATPSYPYHGKRQQAGVVTSQFDDLTGVEMLRSESQTGIRAGR